MPRLSRRVSETTFDLVVVGGGVHGLFAALEAAQRGWAVALFERDDYGSGLSSNHQRTVHGGLRALQSGNIGKTRAQIAERHDWAVMAPHLLRPLPFLLPTYRDVMRSRLAIGTAFRLYNWFGRARNAGLPADLHLPAAHLQPASTTLAQFPGLSANGVTGGAVWYDYQVRHPDRLNWLLALAAQRAGALLFNHVEVTDLLRKNGRIAGVQVSDRIADRTLDVAATRVLLCTGGNILRMHARLGLGSTPSLVRASSLLLDRPALDHALAARGASGRMLTATPWSGYWLVGTFQGDRPATIDDDVRPDSAAIDAMIADANSAFPSLRVQRGDVRLVHSGLTPARVQGTRIDLLPESEVVAHDSSGAQGVVSVIGVKFTTARSAALGALGRLGLSGRARQLSQGPVTFPPPQLPHGTADGAVAALLATGLAAGVTLDDDVFDHLVDWYGTEASDVLAVAASAGRVQRLAPGCPVLDGEVLYAVERSQALKLGDVVFRRTRLGTAGHPGAAALAAAADIMGNVLGWSPEHRAAQIADVAARY
jgi:glycerol-3-phosphate dehydrogenase